MSHRRLLVTLATLVAVFALALAAPFSPAAHAAPPHLPPRVHPNGGGWSSPPHCVSSTAWFVVSNPQPADRPNYRPNYRRIGGPNDGPAVSSQFNGVAATSASDVWAVGYSTDQTTGNDITLIEHYAGSSWSIVTSPNVAGTPADVLSSVAALAPNDAWAVGVVYGASQQALVEQYNGTAWSIIASPSPGVASALNSVAADGPNDVWAVGYTDDSSGTQSPLAEHWDGKAWSVVTPTAVGTFSQFNGVSVVAGQVFAAGSSLDNSNTSHTLVERFVPGSGWSVMSTPDGGTNGSQLNASAALSTTNAWVAGMSANADGSTSTLTENWNGAVWTIVDSGPRRLLSRRRSFSPVSALSPPRRVCGTSAKTTPTPPPRQCPSPSSGRGLSGKTPLPPRRRIRSRGSTLSPPSRRWMPGRSAPAPIKRRG